MGSKKFTEYDMRDDFEFQVYVTDELSSFKKDDETKILYVDQVKQFPGVIKKEGDIIILELSTDLMKPESKNKSILSDNDEVYNEKDFSTLYATTWDGKMQFIIADYFFIAKHNSISFNSVSYGGITKYQVTNFSIASQFMLQDKVYQASFYLDYIHEWFSLYGPMMTREELNQKLIIFENMVYCDVSFSLQINGYTEESSNRNEVLFSAQSSIIVKFQSPQTKDFVLDLAVQLRNFFHFLLNKKVGLYKILLNKDVSWNGKDWRPEDYRENWFVSQSFLPDEIKDKSLRFYINYSTIKNDFENILKNFFQKEKLQNFISLYLAISQYQIPVIPAFLTLSSGVESYLNGSKFSNLKPVKDFSNKLNMIFNGSWNTEEETVHCIKTIKDNRDFYVHGDKIEKKLSEIELVPTLFEFQNAIRNYLKKELGIDITSSS